MAVYTETKTYHTKAHMGMIDVTEDFQHAVTEACRLHGISAGIIDDAPMLDLPYSEDSRAMVDLNCVMNELGEIIELQGTGEGRAFTAAEQQELVELCAKGCRELIRKEKDILGEVL